ncbi:hypothetical protein [Herbaspirillum sp. YR522]|uniref:hypothetical protein n=1 Tax=Herbaspirillum sp. YR522 TaxID=1144342 RepID=UPI00026FC51A|nr:hypothetical protein [Herbaspirillum sp. YR522]EJM99777.1 hypothetical protein PMI40_03663 [Herbaspirillum sp. YR522]
MDKKNMYGLVAATSRRRGAAGVALACAVAWLSLTPSAGAQGLPVVTPLAERYPAGSIKSEQAAAAALAQAADDRRVLDTQYVLDQRECYARFLVSACLEAAKDRKREAEKSIKQVEIEANTYRRQAQVDDRDQSLAEQHARDQAESARRVQEQKDRQAATARHLQESDAKRNQVQQRVDQNPDPDTRIREHEARVAQQQADEAARAPEREANAVQRQQRIKDAEQHRQEVERKKQESERERAEKKRSSQP